MRKRTIGFITFVGAMVGLGLLVNSFFLLVGTSSLCAGHMLLHGKGHEHSKTSVKDDEKASRSCH